jgi:hypothetical protein
MLAISFVDSSILYLLVNGKLVIKLKTTEIDDGCAAGAQADSVWEGYSSVTACFEPNPLYLNLLKRVAFSGRCNAWKMPHKLKFDIPTGCHTFIPQLSTHLAVDRMAADML